MTHELSPADHAWQAAQSANEAFDRLKTVEEDLAALRRIGDLGLQGVTITDEAYQTLEARRRGVEAVFDSYLDVAGPTMLLADSPFASPREDSVEDRASSLEGIFNFAATARTRAEVVNFGNVRGYKPGVAARAFTAVFGGAESVVKVTLLEEYEAQVTKAIPDALTAVQPFIPGRKYSGFPHPLDALDMRTVRRKIEEVLEQGRSDVRNLGPGLRSFWADYLNHALPGIEPLPVHFPPQKKNPQ